MHLTDADLGAVLDPAADATRAADARTHAANCSQCLGAIERVQAADQDVADLLHLLDHATPPGDVAAIAAATRKWRARPRATSATAAVRWGAIILSLSAAAAAALPSVRQFVARVTAGPATPPPAATIRGAQPAASIGSNLPVAPRGVAILAEGHADLYFRHVPPGTVLHIRPATGPQVAVTASTDGSTYTVGHNSIVVDADAPETAYDIDLPSPARLPVVSVRTGDRSVFVRHGSTVETRGAHATDGSYTIVLGGS